MCVAFLCAVNLIIYAYFALFAFFSLTIPKWFTLLTGYLLSCAWGAPNVGSVHVVDLRAQRISRHCHRHRHRSTYPTKPKKKKQEWKEKKSSQFTFSLCFSFAFSFFASLHCPGKVTQLREWVGRQRGERRGPRLCGQCW